MISIMASRGRRNSRTAQTDKTVRVPQVILMRGRFYGGRIHPSLHESVVVHRWLDRNPIEGN